MKRVMLASLCCPVLSSPLVPPFCLDFDFGGAVANVSGLQAALPARPSWLQQNEVSLWGDLSAGDHLNLEAQGSLVFARFGPLYLDVDYLTLFGAGPVSYRIGRFHFADFTEMVLAQHMDGVRVDAYLPFVTASATAGSAFSNMTINDLAYSDALGVWVAAGSDSIANLQSSADGDTWLVGGVIPGIDMVYGVAADGNRFVAVGQLGLAWYSTDDVDWTADNCATGVDLYCVATDGLGSWAAVGAGGIVTYSTDGGQNWAAGSSGTTEMLKAVACGQEAPHTREPP